MNKRVKQHADAENNCQQNVFLGLVSWEEIERNADLANSTFRQLTETQRDEAERWYTDYDG